MLNEIMAQSSDVLEKAEIMTSRDTTRAQNWFSQNLEIITKAYLSSQAMGN